MGNKTPVLALAMSTITLIFILTYPTTTVKVPYIQNATVHCGTTTFTTTLAKPTAITSNAIIGESYTYYYSNVLVINGRTCTVKGKIEYTTLTARAKK